MPAQGVNKIVPSVEGETVLRRKGGNPSEKGFEIEVARDEIKTVVENCEGDEECAQAVFQNRCDAALRRLGRSLKVKPQHDHRQKEDCQLMKEHAQRVSERQKKGPRFSTRKNQVKADEQKEGAGDVAVGGSRKFPPCRREGEKQGERKAQVNGFEAFE